MVQHQKDFSISNKSTQDTSVMFIIQFSQNMKVLNWKFGILQNHLNGLCLCKGRFLSTLLMRKISEQILQSGSIKMQSFWQSNNNMLIFVALLKSNSLKIMLNALLFHKKILKQSKKWWDFNSLLALLSAYKKEMINNHKGSNYQAISFKMFIMI